MTAVLPDSKLVQIGTTKAQLLGEQPALAWGEETTITVRCMDSDDGNSARHWYDLFKDYEQYVGADTVGRLDNGDAWVRDASESHWPVTSNVVQVDFGSDLQDVDDVWALLTAIDDTSIRPQVFRFDVSYAPLAFLSDYATRSDLLNDLASPTVQL